MQWCVVQGGDSNCPPSELTISAPWTVFPWPYFPPNLQLHLCFLPSLLRTAPQINSSPALDVGQGEVQAVWVYVPPWIPPNAGLSFLCIWSQLQRAHRPRVTFTSFCVKIFHMSVSLPLPLKCPSPTLQISSQLPYLQRLCSKTQSTLMTKRMDSHPPPASHTPFLILSKVFWLSA